VSTGPGLAAFLCVARPGILVVLPDIAVSGIKARERENTIPQHRTKVGMRQQHSSRSRSFGTQTNKITAENVRRALVYEL